MFSISQLNNNGMPQKTIAKVKADKLEYAACDNYTVAVFRNNKDGIVAFATLSVGMIVERV
jgi:serine/threonine protein phosphatase PrpC